MQRVTITEPPVIGFSESSAPNAVQAYMDAVRSGNMNRITDSTQMTADLTFMFCERTGIASDIIKLMRPTRIAVGSCHAEHKKGTWVVRYEFNQGDDDSITIVSYIKLDQTGRIVSLEAEVY